MPINVEGALRRPCSGTSPRRLRRIDCNWARTQLASDPQRRRKKMPFGLPCDSRKIHLFSTSCLSSDQCSTERLRQRTVRRLKAFFRRVRVSQTSRMPLNDFELGAIGACFRETACALTDWLAAGKRAAVAHSVLSRRPVRGVTAPIRQV